MEQTERFGWSDEVFVEEEKGGVEGTIDPVGRLRRERQQLGLWAAQLGAISSARPNTTQQTLKSPPFHRSSGSPTSQQDGARAVLRRLPLKACGDATSGGDRNFSTDVLVLEMENQRLRKRVEVLSNKLVYVQQQSALKKEEDASNNSSGKILNILEQQNDALEYELQSNKQETKQLLLRTNVMQKQISQYEQTIKEQQCLVENMQEQNESCGQGLEEHREKVENLESALSAAESARSGEVESREHYECMLKELQSRYAQLTQHVQELEEKRSSFAEGLREKSSQLDNVSALLQISREEGTQMAVERDSLDRQQRELCWELQSSREEVDALSREVQQIKDDRTRLQKQLTNTTEQLATTTAQLDETTTVVNDTATALQQSTDTMQSTQQMLKLREEEILYLQQQLGQLGSRSEEAVASTTIGVGGDSVAVQETGSLESGANLQEEQHSRSLARLKEEHSKQVCELAVANRSRFDELQHKHEGEVRIWCNRTDSLKAHVYRNRNALGWRPVSPSPSDLKGVFRGALVTKACYRGNKHKRVDRFIKVTPEGSFVWSSDLSGRGHFDSQRTIPLETIFRTEYGPYSQAQLWSNSQNKELPWRCFSLFTAKRSFDFIAKDDRAAESFVIGLGRLIAVHSASPVIQSRSEFLVRRVNLKLSAYCARRGISHKTLWLEAIRRTLSQQPDILMRHRGEPVTPKRPPKKRSGKNK
eukprot:GHVS01032259.1.p1 GENE.GHVS01032259.1~~GHVS01032259.1.p1  ORF type:complete len:707 (+),score=133.20 GHVS01032259.1:197-2317(+)